MRIRDAANVARTLVIIHLFFTMCLQAFNLIRMLPAVSRGPGLLSYLFTTSAYTLTTIILDIALLIVFSSLARIEEQCLRDRPDSDEYR